MIVGVFPYDTEMLTTSSNSQNKGWIFFTVSVKIQRNVDTLIYT